MSKFDMARLHFVLFVAKVAGVPIRVREEFYCPWLAMPSDVGSANPQSQASSEASPSLTQA